MEILNKITYILTTEDATLTSLITDPIGIVECWISFLLISTLFKFEYTKKQKHLYILGLFLLS